MRNFTDGVILSGDGRGTCCPG